MTVRSVDIVETEAYILGNTRSRMQQYFFKCMQIIQGTGVTSIFVVSTPSHACCESSAVYIHSEPREGQFQVKRLHLGATMKVLNGLVAFTR